VSSESRQQAGQFLLLGDGTRAGPRGFGPDVDQVRALLLQPHGVVKGRIRIEEATPVGEGVRGHIQDAHHEDVTIKIEVPVADAHKRYGVPAAS
jgi:hypothetical protein